MSEYWKKQISCSLPPPRLKSDPPSSRKGLKYLSNLNMLSNCQAEAVVALNKAAAFLDPFNDVFRTSLPPDLMSTVNVFTTNKSVLIKQQ